MVKYTTKRLNLRWANDEDSTFIFNLLNSPTWIKYIGDRNINSSNESKEYIQNSLVDSYRKNGFGMYIMERSIDKTAMGLCGFLKREDLDSVDIGFAILPEFTKQGYTYEAAHKIISEADYSVIYGITSEGNQASRKLLEKLGMIHLRNFQFGNYEEESMLYGIEQR